MTKFICRFKEQNGLLDYFVLKSKNARDAREEAQLTLNCSGTFRLVKCSSPLMLRKWNKLSKRDPYGPSVRSI